jgi:hypothetical protein
MYLFIILPAIATSIFFVPLMLLTKWDGRTTIFGNEKWGRGNNHFSFPTKGFGQELVWLIWRNPVNNLHSVTLATLCLSSRLIGNPNIGDKIAGGFYSAFSNAGAWEYYWVKPYILFGAARCIRVRIGWKIKDAGLFAPFVFAINPWKPYSGLYL